ncbi:histidine kinase [Streptomyces sp. SID3343]|uniref:sensor histidine kinase n=1 Tax=Streptomyces sp. SID3343 TaxID=2690260 RepID=UPI001370ED4C|nr:histidine kinase [Streptomyces sp. SID3343]MYW02843.1 sensor histidine kinase [Streptomyces sp. SID3343]
MAAESRVGGGTGIEGGTGVEVGTGARSRAQSIPLQDFALALAVLVPDVFYYSEIAKPETTWAARLAVLGLALPEGAALVLRRRLPVTVFAVVWAVATAAVLLTRTDVLMFTPYFGLLLALYTVAEQRRRAVGLVALALSAVPAGLVVYDIVVRSAGPGHVFSASLGLAMFYVPLTIAAWGLARWGRAARAAAERDRRELAEAREAVRRERASIAHELHGIVSHAVVVMVMQAEEARSTVSTDPARADEALGHIENLGRSAMSELRRMLRLLRTAGISGGHAARRGPDDLEPLLADVRRAGVLVDLEVRGSVGTLDDSVGLTAYRCIQEALTNITKHAGPGTHAVVRITWSDVLLIEVVDDGGGRTFPLSGDLSTGHGLLGLAERVAVFGGELSAGPYPSAPYPSAPDRSAPHRAGFRVAATLPVAKAAEAGPPGGR